MVHIKTHHRQIMATITHKILKFKPMIKKPATTNNTFFIAITFSNINSFI